MATNTRFDKNRIALAVQNSGHNLLNKLALQAEAHIKANINAANLIDTGFMANSVQAILVGQDGPGDAVEALLDRETNMVERHANAITGPGPHASAVTGAADYTFFVNLREGFFDEGVDQAIADLDALVNEVKF